MSKDLSRATPLEVLREVWGYDSFRPMQEEVISRSSRDTTLLL